MSASGAPKNIDGIESRNVWVIPKLMMNVANARGDAKPSSEEDNVISRTDTRFTWIPGTRPVKIPAPIPAIAAIIRSIPMQSITKTNFSKISPSLPFNGPPVSVAQRPAASH